jgi:hypothetical protein
LTRRVICVLAVLAMALLGACSGDDDDEAGDDKGEAAGTCTLETAEAVQRVTIKGDEFSVTCAKADADEPFTFVNGEDVAHNVSSQAAAPVPFDDTLGQLNSTYTATLRPGTYEVVDKLGDATMTVIVE